MNLKDFEKRVAALFLGNKTASYHLDGNGDICEGEDGWFSHTEGNKYTVTRKVCGLLFTQTLDELYDELDGEVDEMIESAENMRGL